MTIEYRTTVDGAGESDGTVNGLVTPFNVRTVIGNLKTDGFREEIAPGAFKKTLQERDVVFLFNHNKDMPLARISAGNLTLREDPDAGLQSVATPVDTTYGQDLIKLTKAKVVKGMSFGFNVIRDSWTDEQGNPSDARSGVNRTIHEIRLHEVSAVTFPQYETSTFSARDAISAARTVRETRAAAAAYSDLETCGECGSTDEYGSFCSACGESMSEPDSTSDDAPAFCSACGSARSHVEPAESRNTDSADSEDDGAGSTTPDDETHAADLAHASRMEAVITAKRIGIKL